MTKQIITAKEAIRACRFYYDNKKLIAQAGVDIRYGYVRQGYRCAIGACFDEYTVGKIRYNSPYQTAILGSSLHESDDSIYELIDIPDPVHETDLGALQTAHDKWLNAKLELGYDAASALESDFVRCLSILEEKYKTR